MISPAASYSLIAPRVLSRAPVLGAALGVATPQSRATDREPLFGFDQNGSILHGSGLLTSRTIIILDR